MVKATKPISARNPAAKGWLGVLKYALAANINDIMESATTIKTIMVR
jgi:hypothetical protein